jgi:POT family proton-dependent oligopeptide transporter
LYQVLLPAIIIGIGAWLIPGNIFGSDSSDAFLLGSVPVVCISMLHLYFRASDETEKKPIGALACQSLQWWLFSGLYSNKTEQLLTTWAQYYTNQRNTYSLLSPSLLH